MSSDSLSPASLSGLSVAESARATAAAHLGERHDVAGLIAMLDDPSWKVRRRVVELLAAEGAIAVEPLCELLRTRRDSESRLAAAVDALSASVAPDDTAIWRLAKERSPAVAADAAQVLGRRGQSDSIPILILLMGSKDDNVAVTAIEAIGRIGGSAAVDALLECVHSESFFRAFPAIELLGRSGDPRVVQPLARLLERPHYAREAARALGRTGELGAVPALAHLLSHSRDSTVRLAAMSLADLDVRHRERYGGTGGIENALARADTARRATERLCRALTGADPQEQTGIAGVLGALGEDDAVPHLAKLLDGPKEVATAAAKALQRIGKRADDELLRVLRDGTSGERRAVLPFCAKKNAVPQLLRCLSDAEPSVRALAAEILAKIGDPTVVRHLFPLLGDADIGVAQSVSSAIQSLGSEETIALATATAQADSPVLRRAALRILGYFGGAGCLEVFTEAIEDADPRVRDVAIQGLAFVDDPRAHDKLVQAAEDEREKVRASAARALGQCAPSDRILRTLTERLTDPDPWVRYYACQSLGRAGYRESAPSVAKLVADPAGQVRVAAVEALSHLQTDFAFRALSEAARSSEPDIKRAALIGLGFAEREESLPLLIDAVDNGDGATRLVAVSTLAGFADGEVIPAWDRSARDADQAISNAALANLSSRKGKEATDALVGLLTSSKIDSSRVLAALSVPVSGRVAAILAALHHADEELSPKLTSALARMRHPEANDALLQAFQSTNPACRKAAASALAAIGLPDGLTAMRQAAAEDKDPQLKRICSLLLAQ